MPVAECLEDPLEFARLVVRELRFSERGAALDDRTKRLPALCAGVLGLALCPSTGARGLGRDQPRHGS